LIERFGIDGENGTRRFEVAPYDSRARDEDFFDLARGRLLGLRRDGHS
jgi:hypothetical protein